MDLTLIMISISFFGILFAGFGPPIFTVAAIEGCGLGGWDQASVLRILTGRDQAEQDETPIQVSSPIQAVVPKMKCQIRIVHGTGLLNR